MNLLTTEKISKSYADKILFEDITFGINDGDKIGVIGVNGTGKSTFLKIIAGLISPDSGTVSKMNGMKIGYLPQTASFESGTTVLNQVFNGENETMKVFRDYEKAVLNFENNPCEKSEKEMMTLMQEMDKLDAWGLENEAKNILTRLGITEYDKDVSLLSGGQRKRIAIASALITPVDLLILDEPTNHIDNDTIDWLEKYLARYPKSILMVTHDRYFLDRVVNKTIEIDKGSLYTYSGNYSEFLVLKAEREELLKASERKRQNLYRHELEWIRRGAQARSTKQKARIERFNEIEGAKTYEETGTIEINALSSRLGRKTIEINGISKSYEDKELIKNFSYIILKDDRIGIIGKNGCGKSTLINMIAGNIKPESGSIDVGETVKIGLFSQENDDFDENKRVIDYIKDIAEYITTKDGKISASTMLERFLFSDTLQYSPISKLSGGEKRRLYLLKILMSAPNILILDEPTNDLDIETLTVLEGYLDEFKGAVIAVSHDRYFLDRIAERIFSFNGNGKIKQYEGGYSDFKIAFDRENSFSEPEKSETIKKAEKDIRPERQKQKKMTYNEKREFETISDDIEGLEREISEAEEKISDISSDYVLLQELTQKKDELEQKLEEKMDRWVYLNELNEEIEKENKK